MQGNGLSSLYFKMFIILIVVGFSLVVVAREGGVGGGGGQGAPPFLWKPSIKTDAPHGIPLTKNQPATIEKWTSSIEKRSSPTRNDS